MSGISVEGLYTYPIKSCAGTELPVAEVTERGLAFDRYFMLIDQPGKMITQRTEPRLALVKPSILEADDDGSVILGLSAPGIEDVQVLYDAPTTYDYVGIGTRVHDSPVDGILMPEVASEWFSEYLGKPTDLIAEHFYEGFYRKIKERYQKDDATNVIGFADAFPMLLASQASLDSLNQTIVEETGGSAISMDRFRPNIVVGGDELAPYREDYWRRVQIGQMIAYVVRPCQRCSIPYVNQETGARTDAKTVGKALAMTRRGWDTTKSDDDGKGVYFAQNLVHVFEPGLSISVGDEVVIHDQSDEPNFRSRA